MTSTSALAGIDLNSAQEKEEDDQDEFYATDRVEELDGFRVRVSAEVAVDGVSCSLDNVGSRCGAVENDRDEAGNSVRVNGICLEDGLVVGEKIGNAVRMRGGIVDTDDVGKLMEGDGISVEDGRGDGSRRGERATGNVVRMDEGMVGIAKLTDGDGIIVEDGLVESSWRCVIDVEEMGTAVRADEETDEGMVGVAKLTDGGGDGGSSLRPEIDAAETANAVGMDDGLVDNDNIAKLTEGGSTSLEDGMVDGTLRTETDAEETGYVAKLEVEMADTDCVLKLTDGGSISLEDGLVDGSSRPGNDAEETGNVAIMEEEMTDTDCVAKLTDRGGISLEDSLVEGNLGSEYDVAETGKAVGINEEMVDTDIVAKLTDGVGISVEDGLVDSRPRPEIDVEETGSVVRMDEEIVDTDGVAKLIDGGGIRVEDSLVEGSREEIESQVEEKVDDVVMGHGKTDSVDMEVGRNDSVWVDCLSEPEEANRVAESRDKIEFQVEDRPYEGSNSMDGVHGIRDSVGIEVEQTDSITKDKVEVSDRAGTRELAIENEETVIMETVEVLGTALTTSETNDKMQKDTAKIESQVETVEHAASMVEEFEADPVNDETNGGGEVDSTVEFKTAAEVVLEDVAYPEKEHTSIDSKVVSVGVASNGSEAAKDISLHATISGESAGRPAAAVVEGGNASTMMNMEVGCQTEAIEERMPCAEVLQLVENDTTVQEIADETVQPENLGVTGGEAPVGLAETADKSMLTDEITSNLQNQNAGSETTSCNLLDGQSEVGGCTHLASENNTVATPVPMKDGTLVIRPDKETVKVGIILSTSTAETSAITEADSILYVKKDAEPAGSEVNISNSIEDQLNNDRLDVGNLYAFELEPVSDVQFMEACDNDTSDTRSPTIADTELSVNVVSAIQETGERHNGENNIGHEIEAHNVLDYNHGSTTLGSGEVMEANSRLPRNDLLPLNASREASKEINEKTIVCETEPNKPSQVHKRLEELGRWNEPEKLEEQDLQIANAASENSGAAVEENEPHSTGYLSQQAVDGFLVSDLVWGKVKSHPWWPGQVFDSSDASNLALKYQKKDAYLIAYFGDKTFAWCDESQLKPFEACFSQMEKQSNSDLFVNALNGALEEVSRRTELGMSCSCLPEEVTSSISCQRFDNAGVRKGCPGYVVGNSITADCLEPGRILEFVKDIACFPAGDTNRLELVKITAQLKAFYQSKGYFTQPSFHVGHGLIDEDVGEVLEKDDIRHLTPNSTGSKVGKQKSKGRPSLLEDVGEVLENDDIWHLTLNSAGSKVGKQKSKGRPSLLEDVGEVLEKNDIRHLTPNSAGSKVGKQKSKDRPSLLSKKNNDLEDDEKDKSLFELMEIENVSHVANKRKTKINSRLDGESFSVSSGKRHKTTDYDSSDSEIGKKKRLETVVGKKKKDLEDGEKDKSMFESMETENVNHIVYKRKSKIDSRLGGKSFSVSSGKRQKTTDSDSSDSGVSKKKRLETVVGKEIKLPSPTFSSFKVGDCIRRVASQLKKAPPILKSHSESSQKNVTKDGDVFDIFTAETPDAAETPDTVDPEPKSMAESKENIIPEDLFLALHLAACDPTAACSSAFEIIPFLREFRNSAVSTAAEAKSKVGRKRGRKKKVDVQSPTFDMLAIDHMQDAYWSDMIFRKNSSKAMKNKGEAKVQKKKRKPPGQVSTALTIAPMLQGGEQLQVGLTSPNTKLSPRMDRHIIRVEEKMVKERTPTALILNFNRTKPLPSETDLIRIFSRYGPLKEAATEVQRKKSRVKVVFKRRADAETAFSSAGKYSTFGPSLLSYQLKHFASTPDIPPGRKPQDEKDDMLVDTSSSDIPDGVLPKAGQIEVVTREAVHSSIQSYGPKNDDSCVDSGSFLFPEKTHEGALLDKEKLETLTRESDENVPKFDVQNGDMVANASDFLIPAQTYEGHTLDAENFEVVSQAAGSVQKLVEQNDDILVDPSNPHFPAQVNERVLSTGLTEAVTQESLESVQKLDELNHDMFVGADAVIPDIQEPYEIIRNLDEQNEGMLGTRDSIVPAIQKPFECIQKLDEQNNNVLVGTDVSIASERLELVGSVQNLEQNDNMLTATSDSVISAQVHEGACLAIKKLEVVIKESFGSVQKLDEQNHDELVGVSNSVIPGTHESVEIVQNLDEQPGARTIEAVNDESVKREKELDGPNDGMLPNVAHSHIPAQTGEGAAPDALQIETV